MSKTLRNLSLFFIFLYLFSYTHAFSIQNYEIVLEAINYNKILEFVQLEIRDLTEDKITYVIFGDVNDVYVLCNDKRLEFDVSFVNGTSYINIYPKNCTDIKIRFWKNDLITRNEEYLFFTIVQIPIETPRFNLCFKLPSGTKISHGGFFPRNGVMSTDGEKIIVCWNMYDVKGEIPFSVYFEPMFNLEIFLFFILLIVTISIIFIYYFYKKRSTYFLKGFSEDERKVVQILMERKFEYQNKIRKELKLSRAKMTRIVTDLVKKDIIIKERKGRKNKLIFKELH
ncbi:MAG: hypothetical protein OH319_01140 [Candidatus Parvarchaeota archaeon]|nr:hypothetical protein [Candidatus Jingweiarchaeum tengchongense]MCW1297822.1 hypothetical protein [Candidatus Jingweiarchaeum tengchongense]MCW1299832.1 hypothetical protein [Candidatus Jingweiarchaeum tengchongense]MCW1304197.1 hypothetical protein [Candidatus Jingweiarchaeum tengchongense]MCW1305225.1 hypothetical protein [Candidatus Jingweiarchaeum tengchongense]